MMHPFDGADGAVDVLRTADESPPDRHGERAPSWVAQGFAEYQKRLSHWLPFELVEIEPGLRGRAAIRAAPRRMKAGG